MIFWPEVWDLILKITVGTNLSSAFTGSGIISFPQQCEENPFSNRRNTDREHSSGSKAAPKLQCCQAFHTDTQSVEVTEPGYYSVLLTICELNYVQAVLPFTVPCEQYPVN